VSVGPAGQQANGPSKWPPSISADGRFVAFYSSASNLVAGDTNDSPDVFVRDRVAQVTRRVSVGSGG
jgi:Tol biopolymer transport system component